MPDRLLKKYHALLQENNWQADEHQLQAVNELQRLINCLTRPQPKWFFQKPLDIKGIYMHGGVGRGKSMLMDLFFDAVPDTIKKRRTHFHQFMIETHDWLHAHRGEGMDDLLPRYTAHIAHQATLICFDEFLVTDVADAMILGRLFTGLFAAGVVIVATSNRTPDTLYEGGLQRELFLPFIALLKEENKILHLDSDTDYRRINGDEYPYYLHPLNSETKHGINNLLQKFLQESSENSALISEIITVKGRDIPVQASGDIACFTFADLCEKAYGAEDYIAIAKRYNIIFLTDIPRLTYDRRNEAKRLILLIDCLYEAECRVIISAAASMEKLYQGHDHAFEFQRTLSRLMEMQSVAYNNA